MKTKEEKEEIEVSLGEYDRMITELAEIIKASGEEFNMIIGISRGGIIPATLLSYDLHIPLALMAAESYDEEHRQKENIIFSRYLIMTTKSIGKRCLLVDNLADSGRTLRESIRFLKDKYGSTIEKLLTAVMFKKSCSEFKPDFVVKEIGEEWVKFFYENDT